VIEYRENKEFTKEDLKKLFLSVEWESANYPDRLVEAMKNSHVVISAYNENELIGLMSAISDGEMSAYFPYLLVNQKYQGLGIGKQLVLRMLGKYKNYYKKALICYGDKREFYEKCGFEFAEGKLPMFIDTPTI